MEMYDFMEQNSRFILGGIEGKRAISHLGIIDLNAVYTMILEKIYEGGFEIVDTK